MSRSLIAIALLALTLGLTACKPGKDDASKTAAPVVLTAPAGNDDNAWKAYLGQVVGQHMGGVTDRVYPYYLPANSAEPDPNDPDKHSQYDRQLDNVSGVMLRTVLPGNMLVFGSPDSAKMADLIVAATVGTKPDALKGSQVLFIGKPADSDRAKAAVEAAGGKYIFVEAK
jgi:hypothetical protein